MPRSSAYSAYEEVQREELTGRALEASVMLRASRKLQRCEKLWDQRDKPEYKDALEEALSFTQRLWSFLQVELSNPEHPMPLELRLDIVRLSTYIDRAIMRLHAGGSLSDLRAIKRINQEIAAGLMGSSGSTSDTEK